MQDVIIRLRTAEDSLEALTALIHRAYAVHAARGLRFWGSHQSVASTQERCESGETWLAEVEGQIVATVTLIPPARTRGSPHYDRPDVAKFSQLCVDPTLQRQGVGGRLLDHIEARARTLQARELALDTAEGATGLIAWYARRGYVFVEHVDWRPDVNYRSVLMSRPL